MKLVYLFILTGLYNSYGQRSDFLEIDFKKADSVALSHKGASLKNLPLLTYNLTGNFTTDVEKFRAIYTWICTNIENDYTAYLRTSNKRKKLSDDREEFLKWNHSFTPKVFEKLLTTKKTACTGYAYLIKEMANLAGLKSEIVDGHGRTATLRLQEESSANHSWNTILLQNKWYVCDATWSAGLIVVEEDGPRFKSQYTDGYFLADPQLFIKNHYPLEAKWSLLEKVPSYTEFITGPVVYKQAFSNNIIPIAPQQMYLETVKNKSVSFELTTPELVNEKKLNLLLVHNGATTKIEPEITNNDTGHTLKHRFERAGSFDVHVQYKDAIVATYVVKVRRK
jgi:hypothetical protein